VLRALMKSNAQVRLQCERYATDQQGDAEEPEIAEHGES
jgi:hypothetical protein